MDCTNLRCEQAFNRVLELVVSERLSKPARAFNKQNFSSSWGDS